MPAELYAQPIEDLFMVFFFCVKVITQTKCPVTELVTPQSGSYFL